MRWRIAPLLLLGITPLFRLEAQSGVLRLDVLGPNGISQTSTVIAPTSCGVGCLTYSYDGILGDWNINVTTGTVTGGTAPFIDLNSINHHNAAVTSSTLQITFGAAGLLAFANGPLIVTGNIGGTVGANGTVQSQVWMNPANAILPSGLVPPGSIPMAAGGAAFQNPPLPFSGTFGGLFTKVGPYSAFLQTNITFGNSAGQTSFDFSADLNQSSITAITNLPGATFTITGPTLYTGNGTFFSQPLAPPGAYTIMYGPVSGYLTPPVQTRLLAAGGSIAFSGTYQTLPAIPANAALGTSSTRNASPFTSEPVNVATGNFYSSSTDLAVPGRGLAFAFTRSYNSFDSYSGPLGIGWTHSFNALLLQNADNSVSVKDVDGGIIGYMPSGTSYTPSTPGVFDSLKKNSDGSFTLTRKNHTQLNFSSSGQLATIVDRNGNTQTLSYSGGNLASLTDSSGRLYSFAYDGNGHLVNITDPLGRNLQYGYDTSGRLASFQDATGATTSFVYDSNNRLVSATDPRGNTYLQNTYDARGRVVVQTNARNFATTFAYDTPATGTTTITDPLGNMTKDVLDGLGRLSQQIDSLGGTTFYTYDANNLKLSVTDPLGRIQSFTYDGSGNCLTWVDPMGKTSSFTYDNNNNLLSSTDRLGRTTTFTYDLYGNFLTGNDAAHNKNSFTYDGYGQTLTSINARGFSTSFNYNSAGDLTKVTDALGGTVAMTYDAVGRLTTIQNQLGKTTARTYDPNNRLLSVTDPLTNATQFQYDPNGNLTKITDPNGKQTQYAYDATNKLSQVTDAIGGATQYQYNANTDLTAITDAARHTTAYAYDALRRLSVVTDPLARQKRYGYDAVGNNTSTIDGNSKTNIFGYDSLNRLLSMSLSDGKSVAYTYDAGGNRTGMTDWRGTTSYVYDVLNRVMSIATPDGKTVGYTYDPVGNRTALTYPDGKVAQYSYDAVNRLSKVTDWASKATSYSYDAAGNLIGFTHPNGAASAYQYDSANRLTSIINRSGSTILSSFTYGLDKVGSRLQMTTSPGGVNHFGYDALYRLTSWTAPSGQITQWTYDAVGNRKVVVSSAGTTNYTYDAADQLLTAGPTTLTYDGNGNQLTKTIGSTTVTYGWDTLNRLISVCGASSTQYNYDGDGNRVSQQVSTGTYAYVIDPAAGLPVVLNETGPDGNIDYLFGSSMISATSTAFQYYHQFDGLGSTSNLTDATGVQKANYTYDPWGKLTLALDPVGNKDKYKFTGEPIDANTGLVYLRARYYDSSLARFINRDPLPGNLGAPLTHNFYQYALSNPIRHIDPSGMSSVDGSGGQILGAYTDASSDLVHTFLIDAFQGANFPEFVIDEAKHWTLQVAASTAQSLNAPRVALDVKGIDELSDPLSNISPQDQAPLQLGNDLGTIIYNSGTWAINKLKTVFVLQLPPL